MINNSIYTFPRIFWFTHELTNSTIHHSLNFYLFIFTTSRKLVYYKTLCTPTSLILVSCHHFSFRLITNVTNNSCEKVAVATATEQHAIHDRCVSSKQNWYHQVSTWTTKHSFFVTLQLLLCQSRTYAHNCFWNSIYDVQRTG